MTNYPTYKLGEIIDKVPIEFKVKQKEYLPKGKFPVVDQGQDLIGGFVDDESLLVKTELPVIVFGDHTKAKKFIDFPFVVGADGTKIIKPKKEFFIEPKLFYWFLHCVKFPDKGYARHFQYLLKSDIALPPLATQCAIVTRIETLFAELDKAVQHLRTAQQQLKTYRQAVLNHWLNNDDGKWEMVKLGEVLQKIEAGKSFRCNEKVPALHEKGIVKISAVTWGEFMEDECKTIINEDLYNPQFAIHKGDLLISRANTIQLVGNCVLVRKEPKRNIMLSDKVLRLVIRDNVDSDFILYSLRTSKSRTQIQNMSTGNQDSMRNIGQDRIKKIEIPLPPLTEQQLIVQEIESRLSQATASETYIENALQQAEALRQSILKKAFSGELV